MQKKVAEAKQHVVDAEKRFNIKITFSAIIYHKLRSIFQA